MHIILYQWCIIFSGGAVAIDLASRLEYRNRIWALVVENTFTSIPEMAHIILKWKCLLWLPQFCHKNKVATMNVFKKCCVLCIDYMIKDIF